ncbi:serine/threonine-protein kinase [Actinophytocola sp.]|uniref:serine/threonine-protein kinase n=1 Tax=Actinophytocola sp. TaxID=1872138 RepID=UPI003D6A703E
MAHPERIGRYRVSRLLGSGAFASVWLGTDDALGEPVAIKVLAENWANMPDVHNRFLLEARLLRRADSDRVVRMFDIGELPDGRPYFVMSYADRGTVADRMTGPLPIPHALHIAVETARAVAVLHRLGVVHRDIKPSNVLVQSTPGGHERIVISDLGVAKHVAQASGHTIAAGTPGYMAPEQAELGLDVDVRADVYGLGAFTYHLLTGTKYDDSGLRRIALPRRLKQVLARALEQNRDRRWPDAGAFADALADALADVVSEGGTAWHESTRLDAGENVRAAEPGLTRPPPPRRTRFVVVAAACLVVVGAVVATTLALGRNEEGLPVAGGSPTGQSRSPGASPVPAGPLEITFVVRRASGYAVQSSGVDGGTQWANLRLDTGGSVVAQVSVYPPGDFDPTEAQEGDPIELAGRPGFYKKALPDPETGDTPATQTRKPAAVVRYADDAWYVVQSDVPPPDARRTVSRIAAAVRFDGRRKLRFPVRFGRLPDALHACGGLDGLDPGWRGPWNAWIDLCDDKPGTGIGTGTTAVRMMMNPAGEAEPPPRNARRIGGRPVQFTASGATVDCGGFVLSIWVADSHRKRYGRAAVTEIVEALEARDFDNRAKWFKGEVAVPNG